MPDRLGGNLRLLREACLRWRISESDPGRSAELDAASIVIADLMVTRGEVLTGGERSDQPAEQAALAETQLALEKEFSRASVAAAASSGELNCSELERLSEFLDRAFPGARGIRATRGITVSRGLSKKTLLIDLHGSGALPTRLALRMDQVATGYLGTHVVEEYPVLQWLHRHGARVAEPHVIEPTGEVLGAPFMLSTAVDGSVVGGNFVAPPRDAALIDDIAACLAGIHRVMPPSSWTGRRAQPLRKEIEGLKRSWDELGYRSPTLEAALEWVRARCDRAVGSTAIIHKDFNFNNILVRDGRVSAVVDWEFAELGEPACDLGYFFFSAEAVASFAQFLDAYARAGGTVPSHDDLRFHIVLGQLRLAVLAAQGANSADCGTAMGIRMGVARLHRRIALSRLGQLLGEDHY
jgi:aminoglycoside phosphotransferase (APT) family kinase protein